MEIDKQKLIKLKYMERTLSTLLEKIDKEIVQTDVEWLQLKSMAEVDSEARTPNLSIVKKEKSPEPHTKEVNRTELNLNLVKRAGYSDEEFDSD
ncbi:unnamed protein product [Brassicogethes aeneus]|uniref:Uncharacterized protein n=1 Tax=Brassicogethes aeneus TaxID=1431903 RepID=A0A9P0B2A6_BRAAE|nr:unnamed protein product [Brassicogethes aeneus]